MYILIDMSATSQMFFASGNQVGYLLGQNTEKQHNPPE